MKLSRLIEELKDLQDELSAYDLDPEVMSTSDYGDHSHTEQLNNIRHITPCIPRKSPFSDTGLMFNDDDQDEEEINDKTIIALRR